MWVYDEVNKTMHYVPSWMRPIVKTIKLPCDIDRMRKCDK